MRTLTVDLGDRSYPILIGSGLLHSRELLAQHIPGRDAVLISNTVVAPLYAERLKSSLHGRRVLEVILPDGEQHKTLDSASRVFDALIANRVGRDTMILALGGGVIGDLAGFVAACYQRGVGYVQIPTTLLAHVDSSVGGKTAVNHPGGKNMIGAFHQPKAVIADTELLDSLPDREFRSGLAEIIKYGLICDASFFAWLESNMAALLARSSEALGTAIYRSCQIKAQIVGRDEREQGTRALLNLGHTFGHAIEAGLGYGVWLHGEAVAAGTVIAVRLSQQMGLLGTDEVARVVKLFERAGLPVTAPDLGIERYLDLMGGDKKVEGGRPRFILLRAIGDAFITADVPTHELTVALAAAVKRG